MATSWGTAKTAKPIRQFPVEQNAFATKSVVPTTVRGASLAGTQKRSPSLDARFAQVPDLRRVRHHEDLVRARDLGRPLQHRHVNPSVLGVEGGPGLLTEGGEGFPSDSGPVGPSRFDRNREVRPGSSGSAKRIHASWRNWGPTLTRFRRQKRASSRPHATMVRTTVAAVAVTPAAIVPGTTSTGAPGVLTFTAMACTTTRRAVGPAASSYRCRPHCWPYAQWGRLSAAAPRARR